MNIFRSPAFRAASLALALPLSALFLAACDIDSVDSTSAVVSDNSGTIYDFSGLYMNPENDGSTNGVLPLAYPYEEPGRRPSGELVTFLRLLQYGSVLEAYDSAGLTWSGSISALNSKTANFSLSGRTTAGQAVEIAGTMVYNEEESTMDATWIEPSYFGNLYAKATVSPATTNTPGTELALTSNYDSISVSNTVNFTASGCSASYTWDCDQTWGTFSSSGNTARYKRTSGTSSDAVTVTVHCGSESKDKKIEFN